MIREEFQAMAINCTGMWAGFKQTLPSLSEVLAIAAIHFNDPVDLVIFIKLENIVCLHMIQLMPYPSWNFNLWYFLCQNISYIDNETSSAFLFITDSFTNKVQLVSLH